MTESAAVPRWLLAIDSSTEQAGVALFDGVRLAETVWQAGRTQTASLLREIDHLLDLHGLAPTDLAAIGVATGPGTFSGLRVGMGIAKGLVLATGVPILGVPTLDAAAWPLAGLDGAVIAVVAAGRGRLVWATYQTGQSGWSQITAPRNGTPTELQEAATALESRVTITGELPEQFIPTLEPLPNLTILPAAQRVRRPGNLAGLAWERFTRGETDDPATLEPLYLHGN